MAKYGLVASKSNKPATSTNPNDLSFSSEFPLLKVYKKGDVPVSAPATINIDHGLGYIPAFVVTGYGPTGFSSGQRNLLDLAGQGTDKITASANGSIVEIVCSGTWTGQLYYYIFLDPIK